MVEFVVRHASYGLDLIDELTGTPLVGANSVSFEFVGPAPAGLDPSVFLVDRSRWVFEDLSAEVVFSIDSQFYVPKKLQTGPAQPLPSVPPSGVPGVLAAVELKPRAGYPFPPTLTRAFGSVLLASTLQPVVAATVTITAIHDGVDGGVFVTSSTENGQYAVWFQPEMAFDPPWATDFKAVASATVDIGGVPTLVTGSIAAQPLRQQTFNAAAVPILLA